MASDEIIIQQTKIGTPTNNGKLNLCSGAPLYDIPVLPFGYQYKSSPSILSLANNCNLIVTRFSISGSLGFSMGICGPSYAIQFDANGEVKKNEGQRATLTLDIKKDETMAGFFLALGLNASLVLNAQFYKLEWSWSDWRFHDSWNSYLDIKLDLSVDVFKAALDIIMAALQVEDMFTVAAVERTKDTPLAWVGESSDQFEVRQGVIRTNVLISFPVNLWSIIVAGAVATTAVPYINVASGVILAIHTALDVTLSSIGFGPTFGLNVPVSLQIYDVSLDNVKFLVSDTSSGKWVGKQDDPFLTIPEQPKQISFNMGHTSSVHITFGLYAELQLFEFLHVGGAWTVDLNDLFGIKGTESALRFHTLISTIGNKELSACQSGCGQLAKNAGMVDVEFI